MTFVIFKLQIKARNANVARPARQQVLVSANAESTSRREAMAVAAGAILLGLTGNRFARQYACDNESQIWVLQGFKEHSAAAISSIC